MKIYSPTQTMMYYRCPMRWFEHYVERYRVVESNDKKVVPLLGNAAGGSFAHYYINGRKPDADELVKVAMSILDDANLEETEEVIKKRAQLEKLIRHFRANDPLPPGYSIDHIEGRLSAEDNAPRIDLGGRDEAGDPFIMDFKLKLFVKKFEIEQKLFEFENNWQMLHYLWQYSEALQEKVRRYFICLCVLSPSSEIKDKEWEVTDSVLARWFETAQHYWALMSLFERMADELGVDVARDSVPMSGEHWDKYSIFGSSYKCQYYDACFDYEFDRQAILGSGKYIQVEKK